MLFTTQAEALTADWLQEPRRTAAVTMRPEDIKNRTFANALRGYDKDEVRSFLFRVAESSRELHEQLTATEAQLADAAARERDAVQLDSDLDAELASGASVPDAFAEATDTLEVAGLETSPETDEAPNDALLGMHEPSPSGTALPVADEFVEAPTTSLAVAEQSIADRYGAIGDRIADLLRNADESAADIIARAENDSAIARADAQAEAAQVRTDAEERASQLLAEAQSIRAEADAYRDEVMADLANARLEQETALQEARSAAEAEVETFRVDSIAEITSLRSDAFVEIDELRLGANTEVAELRSAAQAEAEAMSEAVLAEATASIADDEANASRLREEAEADRMAARSELEDVRAEVSTLLEQARTQSEFIKQEADEIIRTKVRANFEQAQTRIDVLRNTEVASRERIVLAQTELASALTRLDAEPMPALDPNDSPAVIDEAVARHGELGAGGTTFEIDAAADTDGFDDAAVDADVLDVTEVDVSEGGVTGTDDDALIDIPSADAFETNGGQPVSGADAATTAESADDDSLAAYFGPSSFDEPQTTGDILAGSFGAPADPDSSGELLGAPGSDEFAETEVAQFEDAQFEIAGDSAEFDNPEIEDPEIEGPEFEPVEFGEFTVTEHVVVETADYGDLPVRGQMSEGNDLPIREQATPEVDAFAVSDAAGAAMLSDALPGETDGPELGGAAQEDALARLVREAMQEAVDSARKND